MDGFPKRAFTEDTLRGVDRYGRCRFRRGVSGSFLLHHGLNLTLRGDYDSILVILEKIEWVGGAAEPDPQPNR